MKMWIGVLLSAAGLGLIAAAGIILYLFQELPPIVPLVIVGGVLAIVPLAWSGGWRGWLRQVGLGVGLLVVSVIALEILLRVTGWGGLSVDTLSQVTLTRFDCTNGCIRQIYAEGQLPRDPASTAPEQRTFLTNAQRLYVEADYDPALLNETDFRILVSGDSFTVGFTAEIGRSYIETLDRVVPNTTVWNVAYPGTGMPHIATSLAHWAAIMEPDLLVMGLSANDSSDIFPMDRFVETGLGEKVVWINQYALDESFTLSRLNDWQIRLRYFNVDLPYADEMTATVLQSAVILRLYTVWRGLFPQPFEWELPGIDDAARAFNTPLIEEIGALADRLGIPVIAMHVPIALDIPTPRWMLDEPVRNGIALLDPLPLLTAEDYRNANPADTHWNTVGHEKAGMLLAECVQALIDTGTMCPEAIVALPN